MKLKSLLFGSAAVLAAGTGAQAADLPTVEPVEFVRICDLFGSGFFYIPGTDTCLKLSGYVRAESHYVSPDEDWENVLGVGNEEVDNYSTRVRGHVEWDARTQTDFGLITAFIALEGTRGPSGGVSEQEADAYGTDFGLASAYITISKEWGTMTAGKYGSFFDFFGSYRYGTRVSMEDGTDDPNLFAWTFAGGNGFSFSVSAEDPDSINRRRDGDGTYEGEEFPDGVARIRVDQGWGAAQIMGVIHHVHDVGGGGDEDGLGWAVGAGLKIGLPGGWAFNSQGGYSEGAIAYVSGDPGGIGDLDNGDANDLNTSWSVRAGVKGPIFTNVTVWADGGFINAEENDANGTEYDFWTVAVGGAWEPAPGLTLGPEFAFSSYDFSDGGGPCPGSQGDGLAPNFCDDSDIWGVMWRIQRSF